MTAADRAGRVLVLWCPQLAGPGRDALASPEGGPAGAVNAGPGAPGFGRVLAAVEDFSPLVEVLRPGACAISARGPARYFGGEEPLAAKILSAVAGLGAACQAGLADGLFAAQLAARAAAAGEVRIVPAGRTRAFLAGHPVGVLTGGMLTGSDLAGSGLADLLPRLGIRTLGEYAALPARDAVNRFGAAGAAAHRLARGLPPRPLAPRPPAAGLSVSRRFDPPEPQADPVVFAAKALAARMQAGLSARGLACVRVQVVMQAGNGQESSRRWRHDGLLSALAVAERVRWQLAGWRDSQPAAGTGEDGLPPAGIALLRLVPEQLVRDEGRQLGLWGDAVVSDRVTRAAMQVQAMLGHQAVTRPLPAGGRSPGDQVTLAPFGDRAEPARPPDRPWPGRIPPPAPATVYPGPLPARITDAAGAAVAVTGRALVSAEPAWLSAAGAPSLAITAWAGPWPLSERWWEPGQAARRARFQLVTEDGRAWLAAVTEGRWQLEACYE